MLAAATLIAGGAVSLLASSYPDGLEWSMEKTAGTAELEASGGIFDAAASFQERTAFMPDYDYAAAEEDGSASGTTVAGVAGSVMTLALAGAAGFIISKFKKKRHAAQEQKTA